MALAGSCGKVWSLLFAALALVEVLVALHVRRQQREAFESCAGQVSAGSVLFNATPEEVPGANVSLFGNKDPGAEHFVEFLRARLGDAMRDARALAVSDDLLSAVSNASLFPLLAMNGLLVTTQRHFESEANVMSGLEHVVLRDPELVKSVPILRSIVASCALAFLAKLRAFKQYGPKVMTVMGPLTRHRETMVITSFVNFAVEWFVRPTEDSVRPTADAADPARYTCLEDLIEYRLSAANWQLKETIDASERLMGFDNSFRRKTWPEMTLERDRLLAAVQPMLSSDFGPITSYNGISANLSAAFFRHVTVIYDKVLRDLWQRKPDLAPDDPDFQRMHKRSLQRLFRSLDPRFWHRSLSLPDDFASFTGKGMLMVELYSSQIAIRALNGWMNESLQMGPGQAATRSITLNTLSGTLANGASTFSLFLLPAGPPPASGAAPLTAVERFALSVTAQPLSAGVPATQEYSWTSAAIVGTLILCSALTCLIQRRVA